MTFFKKKFSPLYQQSSMYTKELWAIIDMVKEMTPLHFGGGHLQYGLTTITTKTSSIKSYKPQNNHSSWPNSWESSSTSSIRGVGRTSPLMPFRICWRKTMQIRKADYCYFCAQLNSTNPVREWFGPLISKDPLLASREHYKERVLYSQWALYAGTSNLSRPKVHFNIKHITQTPWV